MMTATAETGDQTCFLITPIRSPGTDEYEHFRALRDTVIEPALATMGYSVIRADDVAQGGAITADIVRRLATARLVVADLTDLNPNVFYELGVRHALRRIGTVLIADKSRTEIPFDLKNYRVIEFTTDLRGVEQLRGQLVEYARSALTDDASDQTDSPVHDFLTSLPRNVFEAAAESHEGELRAEIARLRQLLGTRVHESSTSDRRGGLEDVISSTLAQARRGELPTDLLSKARMDAQNEDRVGFLSALSQLASARGWKSIPFADWLSLAQDASNLNLPREVEVAILDRIIEMRPTDDFLRRRRLAVLAHSEDPELRLEARLEYQKYFSIEFSPDGQVAFGRAVMESEISSMAVMLDAYHNDDLNQEVLSITSKLTELFPANQVALRNHARALRRAGDTDAAIAAYSASILSPDVDDVTASWFSSLVSGLGRPIDSLELIALAAKLDPQDANNWSNLAEGMGSAIAKGVRDTGSGRTLPQAIDSSTVEHALSAAISCPGVQQSQVIDGAKVLFELGSELTIEGLLHGPRYSLIERQRLADENYLLLRSELTHKSAD